MFIPGKSFNPLLMPGAYPRVEHLLDVHLRKHRLYSQIHRTRLEKPARDKRSSLLRTFVNYARKKFYNIGPSANFLQP